MNKEGNFKDDILRKYINPGNIEKTPEGFTSKVMNGIRFEPRLSAVVKKSGKTNYVPVISIAVFVLLVTVTLFLPESKSDIFTRPVFDLMKNLSLSLSETDLSSVFRITLPSVGIYVFIGVLMLTLFDRALFKLFHREK
jgi:hypothetical protein